MKLRDYPLFEFSDAPYFEDALRMVEVYKSVSSGRSESSAATVVMSEPTARRLFGEPLPTVGQFVKMDFAEFEARCMAKIADQLHVDIETLIAEPGGVDGRPNTIVLGRRALDRDLFMQGVQLGRGLIPMRRWDEDKPGNLKVTKNQRTKGSHPQPHYHKGRW
ncbi:hypothetical protein [Vibrio phage VP16T]|nr:hypothetical protein [Vibrio phage VP16T]